ncbi:uncharacterized protein Z518_08926 [Rhinocladiella mackenziei CBS 650.93]|uniref:Major facilitator superfamily (MFS) profile domain-containing protein n=1 Tax=Rhinocladiella mackenziei CBS 650.93 TaxID=1442369 RepID=A0A0D2ID98_9EURO|nr:uncharacterized protein Z518_08926 [Rhinocladiella mackenziei CBS 650.93]KIX01201.1 hypothetical protein Z518_08926 [Rhinocladiella mackenziei CBS 650.93]
MAASTLVTVEQLAITAAVPHENLAMAIVLLSVVTGIGGSMGQTISGAIWTQTLPSKLYEYLPDDFKDQSLTIYGDLVV